MAKTSTVRHQQVAEEILLKAGLLFDELSYGRTSLQDIADAVGIARPSLYHYFKSKEELLATLVDRAIDSREEIANQISTMTGTPQERLARLLTDLGRVTAANPIGLRLMMNYGAALPDASQQRSVRVRRRLFELLVSILTDGMDSGSFRPIDARRCAALMIAAITGLQYKEIGGIRTDPDLSAQMLEQVMVHGVTQPTERRAGSAREALDLLYGDLELLGHHIGGNGAVSG